MLYQKIKALKPKANHRSSVQTNFSTNTNSTVGTYHQQLENKNKILNITIVNKSQRDNELQALIQYQSLLNKIQDPKSQKQSQNESQKIKNSCPQLRSKSCAKTRNFQTKIWSRVNYEEDSYAGRKFSPEKVEINNDSKVFPCLKIQQAKKFLRYQRSASVMRQNVLLVILDNYLQQNKTPQKI